MIDTPFSRQGDAARSLFFLVLFIPGFINAQGGSWTSMPSGTSNTLGAVSFPTETEGWAAGAYGTLLKTTDGGASWTPVNTGVSSTNGFNQVEFINQSTGWVGGTHSIIRTTNGGTTWGGAQYTNDPYLRYGLAVISENQVWRVGGTSSCCKRAVFRSTINADGSFSDYSSWSTASQSTAFLLAVSFAGKDDGWAVGRGGSILRIRNGSSPSPTLENLTSPTSQDLNDVQMLDPNLGFAVGNTGTILKTTNGGGSWQVLNSGTSSNLRGVFFLDATKGWIAGNGGLILATTDGGATWKSQTTSTSSDLRTVWYGKQGWAAGDNGTILKNDPQQILLSSGRVKVTVNWRSQYSGESGRATALPQADGFAYFYFSNPNNPEVFVKVLDFGASSPYLLFWAGLTDFEYTVTFTNVATGKALSFTKPAGSFAGGANNADLPHAAANAVLWSASGDWSRPVEGAGTVLLEESPGRALPEAGTDLILSAGRIAVDVSWRSQYSGQTGQATPIPQKDEFGFFYFSDPGNPEVFVKVLDFGATSPYLVFYAGLTDFEYTVRFRNLQTGQSVSFKKEAGSFNGGADNSTLKH